MDQLMISWIVTLSDKTRVHGDYDRPGMKNPWNRLSNHCKANDVFPTKVELHMFGAPAKIFFENPDGLDGVSIMRGIAKDQAMDGSHSTSFQTLTVCLLKNDCSEIDVAKYSWPYNEFEKYKSVRSVTEDNIKYMIFKNDSEKIKHPEVQKYIHRTTV
tara:strand:+ start:2374 stop:2847 length:474 start_codon:yes stop_codon:yes gene_type:complete